MKCAQCGGNADTLDARVLTIDGDFACSGACEQKWKAARDHFLNVTIHDDKLMEKWWRGEE